MLLSIHKLALMARSLILSFLLLAAIASTTHARLGSSIYSSGIPNTLRELLKPVLTNDGCSPKTVINHHLSYPLVYYVHQQGDHATNAMPHHTSSFFLEKDLYSGNKLKVMLEPSGVVPECAYLPRRVADSIPFSSDNFNDILTKFSIDPNNADATAMRDTLALCEWPAMRGEGKMCTTSLEAMEELVREKMGKGAKALTTTMEEDPTGSRTYSVAKLDSFQGKDLMSCHRLSYPYAVHYCHELPNTVVYEVSLIRDDGVVGEALAVCHRDTSEWRPDFFAFEKLDVKPGKGTICHLLRKGHLLWVAPHEKAEIEQVI